MTQNGDTPTPEEPRKFETLDEALDDLAERRRFSADDLAAVAPDPGGSDADLVDQIPTAELPRLSATELRDHGYLLEANRRFFHPLGLALSVNVDDGTIEVLDDRDDLEGWRFGQLDEADVRDKVGNVARLEELRRPHRERALGYWIQPAVATSTDDGRATS